MDWLACLVADTTWERKFFSIDCQIILAPTATTNPENSEISKVCLVIGSLDALICFSLTRPS